VSAEPVKLADEPRPKRLESTKLYFRIGEVAALAGVEPHILRYWQTAFGFRPERSRAGQRVYSRRVVELVLRIRHLLYVELYTIAGAKRRLRTAETCHHCGKELGDVG
jgi:DNA-binding transcriptional MerR regulator